MNRTVSYFLALITALCFARPVSAGTTIYAAYQGLFSTVGILRVDANTMQPISSIDTSVEPSAVGIYNGSLYDVEGNTIYRRNPTTGAILAQNTGLTGVAGFCISATDYDGYFAVVLTNTSTPGPVYTPRYTALNLQTLALASSQTITLAPATNGPVYNGQLTYLSKNDATDSLISSTGTSLMDTDKNVLTEPTPSMVATVGPDVSATFGTVGPTAAGAGYIWSGFSGPLGSGVFASDQMTLSSTLQYGFFTTHAIGGLAFQNSSLYYSDYNVLYRHDPLTDQTLAQSAALPDIFGAVAVDQIMPGDVNLDGHVDARDISALETALLNLSKYQANNGDFTNADVLAACDVNGDGKVTNADLQALLIYLKSGHGSASSVPEPSTIALLMLGSSGLLFVRSSSRLCRS